MIYLAINNELPYLNVALFIISKALFTQRHLNIEKCTIPIWNIFALIEAKHTWNVHSDLRKYFHIFLFLI